MRMPAVFLVVLLATSSANAAEPLLLHRLDVTIGNTTHTAVCVVPQTRVASSDARFVCFYGVPGQPKYRDNTNGKGATRLAPPSEQGFKDWLRPYLPGAAKCDLAELSRDASLPTTEQLQAACPAANVTSGILASVSPRDFISDVRTAVSSLAPPALAAPLPTVAPPAATTTSSPATDTVTTSATTDTTPTTRTDTTGSAAGTDTSVTGETTDTAKTDTSVTGGGQSNGVVTLDTETRPLLILITLLVALLCLERLWQFVRRRALLRTALSNADLPTQPQTIEEAASMALADRNAFRLQVEETRKRLTEAEGALAAIDKTVTLAKGETRAMRIASLVEYERKLQNIGGSDTALGALESIRTRLHRLKEIDAQVDGRNAADYLRECVALVKSFERPLWSRANDPAGAKRSIDEVAVQLHRLFVSQGGGTERSAAEEIASIEQILQRSQDQAAERQRTIEAQQAKLDTAQKFFRAQWPEVTTGEFGAAIADITSRMRMARAAISNIGCASDRNADALLTDLAALVDRERNAARGAHGILAVLRDYLALPDADAVAISGVVAAESGKPHRVLRLALAAAIPELRTQLDQLASAGDASVVHMLRIAEITDELEGFLARLWTYDGERLWSTGIHSAFAQSWLHNLFRAEAVLRTYFMASALAPMGDILTVVAWAFRHASAASGYDVDRVQLLAVPSIPMQPLPHSLLEFRSCPDIRNRVQTVLKTQVDGGFAVDFDSVGIREGDRVLKTGAVVLANRIEWED